MLPPDGTLPFDQRLYQCLNRCGQIRDHVRSAPGLDNDPDTPGGEAITTTLCRVLVVSASENRDVVTSAMSHWSMDPVCCSGVQEAYSLLPEASPSLIFCEETLVDGTYRDLLREISKFLKSRFVVISPTADLDQNYNEAIALGAFDMIASPCRRSDVQWIAIRAMHEDTRRSASKRRPRPSPEKQKEELDANSEASAGGR